MFLNLSLHKGLTAAKAGIIVVLSALLLVFSENSRTGVQTGVELCLRMLVPSLFPFMVLTNLFVRSGSCASCGKLLRRPAQLVFGIDGSLAPVLLLCLLGGYPVGAQGIAALQKRRVISEDEARQAALFCVCAGPGFVLSFVGEALYHNAVIGRVLFGAQVLSVAATALLARFIFPIKNHKRTFNAPPNIVQPFGQALVASVYDAAKGMVIICAFVTAFSSLTGMLPSLIPDEAWRNAAFTLLEVDTAVNALAPVAPVEQVAFAVGFGGICVHLQILAALGEVKVNRPLFFLFRILQGLLTAAFTRLILWRIHPAQAVFSTAKIDQTALYGGSLVAGTALMAVLIGFLISVQQSKQP